ncbi:hypothetical protein [Erythrobacter sp. AP23]|uniref:hypothetical protein n=1 Tax=Erythrobacter sp. AP23 TaxID=499656 RepID=UPI00076C6D83|nr:hypothetical protein [Erythrobacter sp. AP23]KWV92578.1 hypothetical protein ASS64_15160 [Erythrobacter sp. AP23]
MSDPVVRRQGQPVLFLGLLLVGWCLVRIVTWQNPWPSSLPLSESLRLATAEFRQTKSGSRIEEVSPTTGPAAKGGGPVPSLSAWEKVPLSFEPVDVPLSAVPTPQAYSEHFDTHQRAVGHNLLFMAGMASLPMPRSVAEMLDRQSRKMPTGAASPPAWSISPWRFDAWVVLREGGNRLSDGGARPASYGASQLGAVISYRLAPTSTAAPSIYARASHALIEGGETEGALGLRLRPVASAPLAIHAEARVTERPGRPAQIRPSIFVAGGFDRLRLPAGFEARGYGQAGYVGGDFATAFADGSMVAEKELASFDLGRVSLGGGVWGGAQQGAARLDLGPSVTLDVRLGTTPARIEADYRWRVAGDAEPGDGGVLTLSTGF